MVRVTDHLSEKVIRGFFQTLFWRRRFLANRGSSSTSYTGDVPAIVVHDSETGNLRVPRAMPSVDLTQMRNVGSGSGFSPASPVFSGDLGLNLRHRTPTESEDEAGPSGRTWSSVGAPESQIATSTGTSELYSIYFAFAHC